MASLISFFMPEALPKPEALPNAIDIDAALKVAQEPAKPAPQPKQTLPPNIKSGPKPPVTKESSPGQSSPTGETKEPKPEASVNVPPLPQNHGSKSFNKKFLALCGVTLLEDDRVLLPRQVIPFSEPWHFMAPTVRFVRWQIALQLEETRDDSGVRAELSPVWEQHSLLADSLSYRVVTRPDGCAGFTGRQMAVDPPMYRAEVKRLMPSINTTGWHYHLDLFEEEPATLMAQIQPKFYLSLSESETTRLKDEALKGRETLLRRVFDIAAKEWRWLYELRSPYEARPVVISDRPSLDGPTAQELHDEYSGTLLNAKVYIGGNGLTSQIVNLDPDTLTLTEDAEDYVQSLHLKFDALHKWQDPKLTSVMVPLPISQHDSFRKGPSKDPRNKRKEPGERHDHLREYLDRVVNGAERVVVRRIYAESAIV